MGKLHLITDTKSTMVKNKTCVEASHLALHRPVQIFNYNHLILVFRQEKVVKHPTGNIVVYYCKDMREIRWSDPVCTLQNVKLPTYRGNTSPQLSGQGSTECGHRFSLCCRVTRFLLACHILGMALSS